MKLNERMHEIIRTYSDPDSVYLFPILKNPADAHQAHIQYRQGLNRYNRLLRILGEKVGIKDGLSSYASRYTWANCAYQENVGLAVISKGLGHSQPRTTQVYLQDLDDTAFDSAHQRVIDRLFGNTRTKKKKKKKNSAQELQ